MIEKEKFGKLRPEWAGGFRRVGQILNDGAELARQVFIEMIDWSRISSPYY
jgi:hypothetical protein